MAKLTAAEWRAKLIDIALPIAAIIVAIILWQVLVKALDVPRFIVPAPTDIAEAYDRNPGFIWAQTWTTFVETMQGFAIATVLGVLFAMAVAAVPVLERTLYPILLAINAIPKVAIAPILVVWMGFGQAPKIVMVVLLCFFPIVLSTVTGLRSTPQELVELTQSLGAKALTTFRKVRFPWATQQIFVGLKNAILLAVIGAVIGEFVGAQAGLGWLIVQSGASADTPLAFAAMAMLALMSILLYYTLDFLEKRLMPWATEAR